MDKIEAMRVFINVAELSSFSKTADHLGLPKGSISNAIQQLENQFSTQFLYRTTRKVKLTEDGQNFYERCKDILAAIDDLEDIYRPSNAPLVGRIRVDMPSKLAKILIQYALPDFLQVNPNLELLLSSNDRRIDLIREGFDFVVRIGVLHDSGLMKRHLGNLQMLNCASPEYLQKYGHPKSLNDLENHYLIHYQSIQGIKSDQFEYVTVQGETHNLNMRSMLTVNTTESYTEACIAGLGIIQVPIIGIREALSSGKLVPILANFTPNPMPVSILYPHRRNLTKRVSVFMDWISDAIKRDYLTQ